MNFGKSLFRKHWGGQSRQNGPSNINLADQNYFSDDWPEYRTPITVYASVNELGTTLSSCVRLKRFKPTMSIKRTHPDCLATGKMIVQPEHGRHGWKAVTGYIGATQTIGHNNTSSCPQHLTTTSGCSAKRRYTTLKCPWLLKTTRRFPDQL